MLSNRGRLYVLSVDANSATSSQWFQELGTEPVLDGDSSRFIRIEITMLKVVVLFRLVELINF